MLLCYVQHCILCDAKSTDLRTADLELVDDERSGCSLWLCGISLHFIHVDDSFWPAMAWVW